MKDQPYDVVISRPKPAATWQFSTYEGPTGSAVHRVTVQVRASYQATRPDPNGMPNRIDISREQGRADTLITLERTAAQALVDMLTEALYWDGESAAEARR